MHMEKITPPSSNPRVAALLRTVALFERDDIEHAVDSLIALLDARDGDADMEDDDPDTCEAGDDGTGVIMTQFGPRWGSEHDHPYAEDDTEDFGADEAGECGSWPEDSSGAADRGCYADDDREGGAADTLLGNYHRDRIRRTRCNRSRDLRSPFRLVAERPAAPLFGRQA